jgi:hypothetical protein
MQDVVKFEAVNPYRIWKKYSTALSRPLMKV